MRLFFLIAPLILSISGCYKNSFDSCAGIVRESISHTHKEAVESGLVENISVPEEHIRSVILEKCASK
jgi:hypothetical protein